MELDLAAFPVPSLIRSPHSTAGKPVLPDLLPVGAKQAKLMLLPGHHLYIYPPRLKWLFVEAGCTAASAWCEDAFFQQNFTTSVFCTSKDQEFSHKSYGEALTCSVTSSKHPVLRVNMFVPVFTCSSVSSHTCCQQRGVLLW